MRLGRDTLASLPSSIQSTPRLGPVSVGVVHFGPGAFHRAHQASYFDTLLERDGRWGIAAVSMRSRTTIAALAEQDGLYTIAVRDAEPTMRVIDVHRAFHAADDAAETRGFLADPAVGLVTTTVTEKGYCLLSDGTLDHDHADIRADLGAGGAAPRSVVGWIVDGLAHRRSGGTRPFVVMPCDNLASNGRKLHAALVAFAREKDVGLADWIAGEVRVPCTMVDSITPASDDRLYADVAAALGMEDRAAVQRESFLQWVIEETGVDGPDLGSVGATVTRDVSAWERAKLRILNGAHSTLAYAGLLRGHASVAEAMADADLARFVAGMIADDIAPMLPPSPGLDLAAYARAVLARFRNPGIVHRLDQIAMDGSQKLPYRLGDTLAANRAQGRMPERVVAAFGCWIAFVVERTRARTPIIDPLGSSLAELASDGDAAILVDRLVAKGIALPAKARGDDALLERLRAAAAAAQAGDWARVFSAGH